MTTAKKPPKPIQPKFDLRVVSEDGARHAAKGPCDALQAFALWMLMDWMFASLVAQKDDNPRRARFRAAVKAFLDEVEVYKKASK